MVKKKTNKNRKKNYKKRTKKKGGAYDWKSIITILKPKIHELNNLPSNIDDAYTLAMELSHTLINYENNCEYNNNININNRINNCEKIRNFINNCGETNCEKIILLLRNPIIYTFLTLCIETDTISKIKEKISDNINNIPQNEELINTKPIMLKTIFRNLKLDKIIGERPDVQDNMLLTDAINILIIIVNELKDKIDIDIDTNITPNSLIDTYFSHYLTPSPMIVQSGGEPVVLLIVLGFVCVGTILITIINDKINKFNFKKLNKKIDKYEKLLIKYEKLNGFKKKVASSINFVEINEILNNIPIQNGNTKIGDFPMYHTSELKGYERTLIYAIFIELELEYLKIIHLIYKYVYNNEHGYKSIKVNNNLPPENKKKIINKLNQLKIILKNQQSQHINTDNKLLNQTEIYLRIIKRNNKRIRPKRLTRKQVKEFIIDKSIIYMLKLIEVLNNIIKTYLSNSSNV